MNNIKNQIVRFHIETLASRQNYPIILASPTDYKIYKIDNTHSILEWEFIDNIKQISIGMQNKLPTDTISGSDGQIVEDLALKINKIEFNEVDITVFLDKYGIYGTVDNQKLQTFGYIGFNGSYTFKFRYNPYYMLAMCRLF